MTLSIFMICLLLCESNKVNCIVPIPDAIVLPTTPVTPTVDAGFIEVNMSRREHMWCVAQLSVPNSVGSLPNETFVLSSIFMGELCKAIALQSSFILVV